MKFVLGLVALVLVGLLLYVYTGKENKQPQKQTVHKMVEEEISLKEEVTSVEKKVSEKSKPVVQHTVKKESASGEVQNSTEIHDDELVTDEEYRPNANETSDEPISDKELNAIEKQMIESGQINQEDDDSASTENLGYDPSELTR